MFNYYSPGDLVLPHRRRFLQEAGLGFGSLALASMLHQDTAAATPVDQLALKQPHFPGKVKCGCS